MKNIQLGKITLANGENYAYRHYAGGARTLVLVHGNLASSKFFEELIEKLPQEFTVYAMDLRGFGDSSYNQPLDDLRDLAGDVKLFVDELGLKKFDLLGWSMGGAVSLLFCSHYGEMVERLFLVCAIGADGYPSYAALESGEKVQLVTRQAIREDATKRKMAEAIDQGDADFYRELWSSAIYNRRKPEPAVLEVHVQETLKQRNLFDVYYCVAKYNITDQFNGFSMGTGEIGRIKVPTIVTHGKDDLLVAEKKAEYMSEALGGETRLVVWDECGHSPFVDRLDELVALISG